MRIIAKGDQSGSLGTKASAETIYHALILGNIMK